MLTTAVVVTYTIYVRPGKPDDGVNAIVLWIPLGRDLYVRISRVCFNFAHSSPSPFQMDSLQRERLMNAINAKCFEFETKYCMKKNK